MKRLKWWIDCRIFNKHRCSIYTHRCLICGKLSKRYVTESEESENKQLAKS